MKGIKICNCLKVANVYIIPKLTINRSSTHDEEGDALGHIRIPPETKEDSSLWYGLELLFNDSSSSLDNVSNSSFYQLPNMGSKNFFSYLTIEIVGIVIFSCYPLINLALIH